MAILVISVSSDASKDSMGTPAGQVILFKSDPSEDPSSGYIPPLTSVSPFLSSDDDTTDSDTRDTPPSPTHGIPFTEITSSTQRSPIIPRHRVMILAPGQPIPHLDMRHSVDHSLSDYFSLDDLARDSSLDSSSEASSDFHSDASSDSSSRYSLSDRSSPDLPNTFAGPSQKRRRSPMTSVLALPPVSEALSPVCADLIPSPKRVRESGYLEDVEVGPRETSLRDDVIARGSDKPYLEQDIDPEIQAEIDGCFAYADALKDRGIDARVIVRAVDRDEIETGVRGPIEVRVKRITHPAMPEDIPEPAQEGAVEVTYETLGDLVQRFHDHTEAIPVHHVQFDDGLSKWVCRQVPRLRVCQIGKVLPALPQTMHDQPIEVSNHLTTRNKKGGLERENRTCGMIVAKVFQNMFLSFHNVFPYVDQTDDELTKKELKQIEADDQAIQTILLEIWLRVQQMMKGFDIGIQEKKAKLFNEWERKDCQQSQVSEQFEVDELKAERLAKTQNPLALMATSNNPYTFQAPHQDQPSFNQNYMQQPMPNPEDITDPITAMTMALALKAKAFKLNYSTPTNNNQRISSNLRNRQIAQSGNLNGYNAVQNVSNQVIQNAAQNPRVQNIGNQNRLIGVPGNANQNLNGNGNLVAERAEGNTDGHNENQIRCYNSIGVGHFARNCTVRPRRRDAAYLQTQLLFAQKEEAGIQVQAKEFDLMAAAADLDEIEESIDIGMILETHKWSSSAHQELHKIVKDENFPIVNQVDARVQNFEIQFLKEAAKFVGDFKSLAKEADESLAKHKALELEIERLLRAVVSRDIMSVV
nr:hypothetical protein [Tanacetum cinerariifolium]